MSNEIKKIEQTEIQWPAIVSNQDELKAALVPAELRSTLRKVDSPIKAYQSEAPTLAAIKAEHGEKFCRARLCELLLSLENYLGSQCDLSKDQYLMLAEDIIDSFYAINVADVNLILRRIMHGECGKIYGKVTPAYIYQVFADYYKERTATISESHRASEDSIAKHGYDRTKATATEEQVAELYQKYRQAYEAKKEQEALIHLSAQTHLKEVLTTFKNHVKNDTTNQKDLP